MGQIFAGKLSAGDGETFLWGDPIMGHRPACITTPYSLIYRACCAHTHRQSSSYPTTWHNSPPPCSSSIFIINNGETLDDDDDGQRKAKRLFGRRNGDLVIKRPLLFQYTYAYLNLQWKQIKFLSPLYLDPVIMRPFCKRYYTACLSVCLSACPARTFNYNTPFTRSSKHRANVEQMYSKYTC